MNFGTACTTLWPVGESRQALSGVEMPPKKTMRMISSTVAICSFILLFISGCASAPMPSETTQSERINQQQQRAEQERRAREWQLPQGYAISADGQTVTDRKTGLIWMRCSLGQSWNGRTCAGEARQFSWEEARQQTARGYSHAGYGDWRLPSIAELKTLVHCSSGKREGFNGSGRGGACLSDYRRPTILEFEFPGTPPSGFWSGSPYGGDSDYAWYVVFRDGNANNYSRNYGARVRLVRTGQ